MLTEDPTAILTQIREGTHSISSEACYGQALTEVNNLFQSAACQRGEVANNIFQSEIRSLAIRIHGKGELPATCAEYVKLVDDKIFKNLPEA